MEAKDPNIEVIEKLDIILKDLFTILLNIYKNEFPSDAAVINLQRAGVVLNELVLKQLRGEQVAFKNNNADFINKEKIRVLMIEKIRKGVLSFLIAKGAIMKIWDHNKNNVWINRAIELEQSITIPNTTDGVLEVIKSYLLYSARDEKI